MTQSNDEIIRNRDNAARSVRWKFSRVLVVRRWRIVTHFRAYHGNGSPNFEFEFRLGLPRFGPRTSWADALDDDDLEVMRLDAAE